MNAGGGVVVTGGGARRRRRRLCRRRRRMNLSGGGGRSVGGGDGAPQSEQRAGSDLAQPRVPRPCKKGTSRLRVATNRAGTQTMLR